MSDGDSPHCPGCQFTVAQWARLRAWLCLPPGVPDSHVGDALALALTADKVLSDELSYLSAGSELGYVHGQWIISDVPPPAGD